MLVKVSYYEYMNDNEVIVYDFVESVGGIEIIVNCTSRSIYEEYCDYCKRRGEIPMHITPAMKYICSRYDCTTKVVSVKGKKCRVLVRKPKVA